MSAVSRPSRARAYRQHRRCPGQPYYRTRLEAEGDCRRYGSIPAECSRCGGFHPRRRR
ncbi:hypothetical protein Ae406Ps2_3015c [Pseudonocardia sp. Ae406_Ps2]|uniref:hypothetical protein n=1 Tax=unclassified Pseudonocardia TaxID=2619320 RepID=UPI000966FD87|nr:MULTISPECIES: hypothetical protein [unclassified Pseudonocardia]OLM03015.1 hypothetical protein Ae406Ps2_3015c [Pseudonocardia sp. Ae406_Ps2]OLM12131.1 hypothetical protein Ae505Ps2_2258 [Pseudonocardia sp. Ae505_Ps2]